MQGVRYGKESFKNGRRTSEQLGTKLGRVPAAQNGGQSKKVSWGGKWYTPVVRDDHARLFVGFISLANFPMHLELFNNSYS